MLGLHIYINKDQYAAHYLAYSHPYICIFFFCTIAQSIPNLLFKLLLRCQLNYSSPWFAAKTLAPTGSIPRN